MQENLCSIIIYIIFDTVQVSVHPSPATCIPINKWYEVHYGSIVRIYK